MRAAIIPSMSLGLLLLVTPRSAPAQTPAAGTPAPVTAAIAPKPAPEVQALLDKAGAVSDRSRSLALLNQALERARTLRDRDGEAQALLEIGRLYDDSGQPEKALAFYNKALLLYRQVVDRGGEAWALNDVGGTYHSTGQPQKALEFYNKALLLHQQRGDKNGEAWVLKNIGEVYSDTGQPQKALEFYSKTLTLYQQTGSKNGEATAWEGIGEVYSDTGQPQKALEFYNKALPLYQQTRDKNGEAGTLDSMGEVYSDTGQPQTALESYNRALPLYQETGDKGGEATALVHIGNLYDDTGQPQKALEFCNRALPLFRQTEDKSGEAWALNNIAIAYDDLGQPQKALACYKQALLLYREIGEIGGEATVLGNIGIVYRALDQPRRTLEYCNKALPLFRQVEDKIGEATALNNMGIAYRITGQFKRAMAYSNKALPLFQQAGDKSGEAWALASLGRVNERQGNLAAAERSYAQAVACTEQIRTNLANLTELKIHFLEDNLDLYRDYLRLLLREGGRGADAFALAQKTKARGLLDVMAAGKVVPGADLLPDERQKEHDLRARCDVLNAKMVAEGVRNEVGSKKRFAAYQEELRQAERDLATFTDALYARHPTLATQRIATTTTAREMAALLPPDTALLEYVTLKVGNQKQDAPLVRDETVLFVMTTDARHILTLTVHRLPITAAEAACTADTLRAACFTPSGIWLSPARRAYDALLAPVEKRLAGKQRLLICPDEALWDVPFAVLTDHQGVPLLEHFELCFDYSATGARAVLTKPQRPDQVTGMMLAMADPDFGGESRFSGATRIQSEPQVAGQRPISVPDRPISVPDRTLLLPRGTVLRSLPGTEREAAAIRRDFPSAAASDVLVLTHKAAQEATLKREAGKYRYLHLATHGFFNDAAPLLSSLVLAMPPATGDGSEEDGFLTAREIFDMDLSHCELTVLSACDTARGEKHSGEGVIGLTWALFVAGCPSQVLSQWPVNDASTAALMERFYANLSRQGKGMSKGSALRAAALSLRQSPSTAHPYYWAPFLLVGDWR